MDGRFGGNKTAVSSCQDCHMPDATGEGCAIAPPVRDDLAPHTFAGVNTWVLNAILALDVTNEIWGPSEESFLTQQEVDAAIALNVDMLQRAADLLVAVRGDELRVRVINQTGHKLPTGYHEGRRIWLNVRYYDENDMLVDERGAYDDSTATLTTNDTKVYEAKMGLDAAMATLTGLPEGESFHFVLNNKYYLDNRIPPRGFTNAGFESVQAAPVAYTYNDGQYWDDTTYDIPCNAVRVDVTLYHQTTSREYVEFLRDENSTNDRGDIAYDQWMAHGRSAPVAMVVYSRALPDCNANGVLDACDVSGGMSDDVDGNGVPDECQPGIIVERVRVPGGTAIGPR